ncbi:MAG: flavin reductase family protein [Ruminococcaceae bacterium]|nr:flavin reductase family protein [Oscillospiraceae bacterium]
MKKNLGSLLALYPTPITVVGAMTEEGKPNWMLVAHVGIIGHDRIMISCAKSHYTNIAIRKSGVVSVNLVDEKMLPKADYVGGVSGANTDKSSVFSYTLGENAGPVIDESPLALECTVVDNYETETFDNFILKIEATYAEESVVDKNNKPDYNKLKPVLFEFPTYSYLKTGDMIGKCLRIRKD